MSKCNIVSEKFSPEIIAEFAKLSRVEYGDLPAVTSKDHLNWKHLNGPFGASTALHLKDGDKIVGRTILQPRTFQLSDKKIKAAFVTDALVHPSYRRPVSNFLSLTLAIKEAKDFDVIFHSSNEKTENIYKKILRFSNPFSLQGFGLPLKLGKLFPEKFYLRNIFLKLMGAPYRLTLEAFLYLVRKFITVNLSEKCPQDFDEFCQKECQKNNFLTVRNQEILQWRFRDAPLWKAGVSHVYGQEKYFGYIVWRQLELSGCSFFVIMDFLLNDELSKLRAFALRCLLIKKAMLSDADIIFTLLNPRTKLSKKFLGLPFVGVPDKFLPHATPIFVHANNPSLMAMEQETALHLTLSDIDYF